MFYLRFAGLTPCSLHVASNVLGGRARLLHLLVLSCRWRQQFLRNATLHQIHHTVS